MLSMTSRAHRMSSNMIEATIVPGCSRGASHAAIRMATITLVAQQRSWCAVRGSTNSVVIGRLQNLNLRLV